MATRQERIDALKKDWAENPRWKGIERSYTAEDVISVAGSEEIQYTLATNGAKKLWDRLTTRKWVAGLGALTGAQAVQEVQAGLPAIYLSGWQVAADANFGLDMYPDQSLYPADSVPKVATRINNALARRDKIQWLNQDGDIDWYAPIVADAEAGFGGNLNAFELMKDMIEAGVAGVHFEDQLSSAKKCGHLGGKVLVPTQEAINKLVAARLAADSMGVPTVLIARTDAEAATLLNSDIDPRDQKFITSKERSSEGFYYVKAGVEMGIDRAISFAPHADIIWMETGNPDLGMAREFAQGVHEKFPGKMLAYNCSPSFNWAKFMDEKSMESFREDIAELGYKFQFITLAGFHALNYSMFDLSKNYLARGMAGFSQLQQKEFAAEKDGFTAVRHQAFVGAGYFDALQIIAQGGHSSTTALTGSTEEAQF